jgi:hypothetical protein
MPNPWVSLRRDQLIPVNMPLNKKEQMVKGLEEEWKKESLDMLPTVNQCDQIGRIFIYLAIVYMG